MHHTCFSGGCSMVHSRSSRLSHSQLLRASPATSRSTCHCMPAGSAEVGGKMSEAVSTTPPMNGFRISSKGTRNRCVHVRQVSDVKLTLAKRPETAVEYLEWSCHWGYSWLLASARTVDEGQPSCRRLYQQQSRKLESSTHLPPFHVRMRMDKYISRCVAVCRCRHS
jgi:hypothetical protein